MTPEKWSNKDLVRLLASIPDERVAACSWWSSLAGFALLAQIEHHMTAPVVAAVRRKLSVEVDATDQGEPGAERDARHDVGARHDARVEVHLGVVADLVHDLRQQVEGDRRSIELPTAVIRECDGVIHVLHAFDDELAGPLLLNPLQIVVRHRGVEHRVEQFADRAVPARQARKGEPLGSQEVPPPLGAGDGVDNRADRERRRNREAVALVAQARARDGHVDRDE